MQQAMHSAAGRGAEAAQRVGGAGIVLLGVLALAMQLPVTLPVPVLRGLVQERFAVSELLASLFMSANMVGAVIAAPLAGALADRFGRRPLCIAAALLADALLFLSLTLELPYAAFLTLRFFEGCAHISAISLLLGLAADARPAAERGWVMGVVGAGMMLGVGIGAPLGGWLGADDVLRPLYIGAVLLLACAPAVLWLRETAARQHRHRPGLAEIAGLLRRRRLLLLPLLFAFADRFTVGFFTTTFSFFLSSVHGFAAPQIGVLFGFFMLPFAMLSLPCGWLSQRSSRALLLCGGSLLYGVLVASLGHWPGAWLVAPMLASGAAAALMFVPSLLMTSELTPGAARTTALGAFNAAGSLGFIIGPVVGGAVSQIVAADWGWLTGYRAAFWVAGASEIALALLAFPLLWRFEKSARNQPGAGEPGAAGSG